MTQDIKDKIEAEANRYANDFSETSSQHPFLKRGYIAAASKYLLQNMEDKKRIAELEKQHEELLPLYQLQANVIQKRNERIKDLEDGLRSLTDFSNTWGQEWFNKETWDIIEKAKQLLNPK